MCNFSNFIIIITFLAFIYLKGFKKGRDRKGDIDLLIHSPHDCNGSQTKLQSGARSLIWVSRRVGDSQGYRLLLSQHTDREWNWKWSSQDSNCCSQGTLA